MRNQRDTETRETPDQTDASNALPLDKTGRFVTMEDSFIWLTDEQVEYLIGDDITDPEDQQTELRHVLEALL